MHHVSSRSAFSLVIVAATAAVFISASTARAEAPRWELDRVHTGVYFKIKHLGMSYTFGRFNQVAGDVKWADDQLDTSSLGFAVQAESVDTGHEARDQHLRAADFLNAAEHELITFRSTEITESDEEGVYEVTGDLTLHGVTKSITIEMTKLGQGVMRGTERLGFATEFTIDRTDFGMNEMVGPVGKDVTLMVSFEATR